MFLVPDNGAPPWSQPRTDPEVAHSPEVFLRPGTAPPTGFFSLPRTRYEALGVLGVWYPDPRQALQHLCESGQVLRLQASDIPTYHVHGQRYGTLLIADGGSAKVNHEEPRILDGSVRRPLPFASLAALARIGALSVTAGTKAPRAH